MALPEEFGSPVLVQGVFEPLLRLIADDVGDAIIAPQRKEGF